MAAAREGRPHDGRDKDEQGGLEVVVQVAISVTYGAVLHIHEGVGAGLDVGDSFDV